MQTQNPFIVPGNTPSGRPASSGGRRSWLTRAADAYRRYRDGRARTRVVSFGDPEAFVDRPGERRIVFGQRVIIVTDPKAGGSGVPGRQGEAE